MPPIEATEYEETERNNSKCKSWDSTIKSTSTNAVSMTPVIPIVSSISIDDILATAGTSTKIIITDATSTATFPIKTATTSTYTSPSYTNNTIDTNSDNDSYVYSANDNNDNVNDNVNDNRDTIRLEPKGQKLKVGASISKNLNSCCTDNIKKNHLQPSILNVTPNEDKISREVFELNHNYKDERDVTDCFNLNLLSANTIDVNSRSIMSLGSKSGRVSQNKK
eukprot:Awhi_evm1s2059